MTGKVHSTGNVHRISAYCIKKISTIKWLGANRPVAGAQAPNPAGTEANSLTPLRAAGFGPESRPSAHRAVPTAHCTTGAVRKQTMHFQAI